MNLNDALLIWAKENMTIDAYDAKVYFELEKGFDPTFGGGDMELVHYVSASYKYDGRVCGIRADIPYFTLLNDLLEIAGRKDE